jgi:predicted AAA+ superfamily ATPase
MIKEYLLEKKEIINSIDLLERDFNIEISKNFISIILGPRRAGKSYFLFQIMKKLKENEYLYINFEEDPIRILKRENILNIIKSHIEIYGNEPKYLFFDEIQALNNWENFLYYLYESKKYKIVITGSNSKLLSKEIATQLRGRGLSYLLLPFSFKEFLRAKNFEIKSYYSFSQKGKLLFLLRNYITHSTFPQIVLNEINEDMFFKEYIDLVIYKDLIERYKIKEDFLVKLLIRYLASSASRLFSINNVFKDLKNQGIKVSKKTIYKYYHYLNSILFFFSVKKFDYSIRRIENSKPKIYLIDNGLLRYFLLNNIEFNKLMENTVFLHLKRQENQKPFQEVYYYKTKNNKEIDFLVKEKNKIQLIEVAYEFDEEHKKKLMKAMDELKLKESICITWDEENEVGEKGKKIKLIPLWKWLLKE